MFFGVVRVVAMRRSSGLGRVAHGLDVVPVGTDDESAVVVGVVVFAQSRRAVVLAARSQRCIVEPAYLLTVLGRKREMDGTRAAAERTDPELRSAGTAEHDPAFTV